MPRKLLLTISVLVATTLLASPLAAKKVKPVAPVDKPPLTAWSAVWHSAATVEYSSCPGTEPGHQEAFTLTIAAGAKRIVATEAPEQSLPRKLIGRAEQRGKRWVLQLRDKDGKNGMDVWLSDDGKSLTGTRVLVRQASKRNLCTVVYAVEASRDEA